MSRRCELCLVNFSEIFSQVVVYAVGCLDLCSEIYTIHTFIPVNKHYRQTRLPYTNNRSMNNFKFNGQDFIQVCFRTYKGVMQTL